MLGMLTGRLRWGASYLMAVKGAQKHEDLQKSLLQTHWLVIIVHPRLYVCAAEAGLLLVTASVQMNGHDS